MHQVMEVKEANRVKSPTCEDQRELLRSVGQQCVQATRGRISAAFVLLHIVSFRHGHLAAQSAVRILSEQHTLVSDASTASAAPQNARPVPDSTPDTRP